MSFYYRTNEVELQDLEDEVKLNNSMYNLTNAEYEIVSNSTTDGDISSNIQHHIIIYSICIISCIIMVNIRAIMHFKFCMNSSKALHKTIFSCVLQAPMRFFDTNPSGEYLFIRNYREVKTGHSRFSVLRGRQYFVRVTLIYLRPLMSEGISYTPSRNW